jgi:hypothetical protein
MTVLVVSLGELPTVSIIGHTLDTCKLQLRATGEVVIAAKLQHPFDACLRVCECCGEAGELQRTGADA